MILLVGVYQVCSNKSDGERFQGHHGPLFSSPEHFVLKGELLSSLCVRRASFKKWRQTFQTTSPPKPHGQLQPNFTEMILWWSPLKIVQRI
jgi:hypothetical protein